MTANIETLRKLTDLPIVIGFGIKDAQSASAMALLADGIIIGSALVEQIAKLANQEEHEASAITQAAAVIGIARESINNIK